MDQPTQIVLHLGKGLRWKFWKVLGRLRRGAGILKAVHLVKLWNNKDMRRSLHALAIVLGLILVVLLCEAVYTLHFAEEPVGGGVGMASEGQNSRSRLAPLFTEEVRYWEPEIVRWAQTYDLDPNLVATVMQIESCGYVQARSRAGAMGLFQVMPYHFAEGEDPYDPETNARRGLAYLKRAWDETQGDVRRTLAAYNGGFKRLNEPEVFWPDETRRYVAWGMGIYQDAVAGKAESATLQSWLDQGGWWLCEKARLSLPIE